MEQNKLFKEFDELIKFIILDAVQKGKHEDRRSISKKIGKNPAFIAQKYSEVKQGRKSTVTRDLLDLIKQVYKIENPVVVTNKQATGLIANKSIEIAATVDVILELVCEILADNKSIPLSAALSSAKKMVSDRISVLSDQER